jgi:predicted ATPase
MITGIELGNIRLFDDLETWKFPLSPLTVFCGTNSAGKSTIFKALLLLMQSNIEPETERVGGRLRLVGPLVDLGTFESLVSHRETDREILLGVTNVGFAQTRNLNRLRSLRGVPLEPDVGGRYSSYHLESQFFFGLLSKETIDEQLVLSPDIPAEKMPDKHFFSLF